MLFQSLVYIPVIFGIVLIAMFTIYRQRTAGMKLFSALSFSIAVWLLLQFFIQVKLFNEPLFFARASAAASNFLAYFFLAFTYSFVTKATAARRRRVLRNTFILPIIFTPLAFTNLGLQAIEVNDIGFAVKQAGILYSVQLACIGAYFLAGFFLVYRDTLKKKKNQRTKNYLLIIAFLQAVLVNLLINSVFSTVAATQLLVPLTLFIMVGLIAYAVIKHSLFDIQLIVARSVAYVLTLVTVGLLYAFFAFSLIGKVLFKNDTFQVQQQLVDTVLAVLLVFAFQPMKKFFDKITSHLFYRDAYDTQAFLDHFNKILVSTFDLNTLLTKSAQTIEETLKLSYSAFDITREVRSTTRRLVGSHNKPILTVQSVEHLRDLLFHSRSNLIVTDDLGAAHADLQEELRRDDITVVAKLGSASSKESVGYLLLGSKKSGNVYTSQDLKVIEIVANELVIAIQNALRFEEIENFNATLQERVDDATRKLRRANEKLKQIDETKDDFISMASHQLRTPLTSVKGYLSMVLEGDVGKITPTQREMINQAFSSSQRMVYLIADLLNVSRLKTGKFMIEPKPVNLADLVEQELSQLGEAFKGHNIALTFEKPKHFPELMLDETKTRQVVMNFVDNAIYYTPVGGKITVSLVETPSSVSLRVEDTGIGVPKQEQPHLFTKFYRAGNARKARPDGTGLGLFMAKKVIIAQGGSLIFESQQDKGSTFGFTFSKHRLLAPETESATDKKQPTVKKV